MRAGLSIGGVDGDHSRIMTNGGVRIRYEVEGTRPAVMMHTGSGGDSRIWRYAGYATGMPGYRKILVDQKSKRLGEDYDVLPLRWIFLVLRGEQGLENLFPGILDPRRLLRVSDREG